MSRLKIASKLSCAALLACLIATPALAEKPAHAGNKGKGHAKQEIRWDRDERGHGHGHGKDKKHYNGNGRTPVALRFGGEDRSVIARYLNQNYRGNCPPGLAKKNNGCLPPGQAKKYGIGQRFTDYSPVPAGLASLLGPAPAGTFYAMADTDVLLMSEAGKKVLDAVTLMSAAR